MAITDNYDREAWARYPKSLGGGNTACAQPAPRSDRILATFIYDTEEQAMTFHDLYHREYAGYGPNVLVTRDVRTGKWCATASHTRQRSY